MEVHPGITALDQTDPVLLDRLNTLIDEACANLKFAGIPAGDSQNGATLSFIIQAVVNRMRPKFTEGASGEMIARAIAESTGAFAFQTDAPFHTLYMVAMMSKAATEKMAADMTPPEGQKSN